jgi:hypothetical protein
MFGVNKTKLQNFEGKWNTQMQTSLKKLQVPQTSITVKNNIT